jgi:hypothetical protein
VTRKPAAPPEGAACCAVRIRSKTRAERSVSGVLEAARPSPSALSRLLTLPDEAREYVIGEQLDYLDERIALAAKRVRAGDAARWRLTSLDLYREHLLDLLKG